MRRCSTILMLLFGLSMQPVTAAELQSLGAIEQTAYTYALSDAQASYGNPQVIVDPLDNRLRLQACQSSLQAFANTKPNTMGNRTIGVSCTDASSWTVYVPVKIKVMRQVVVAARHLSPDITLTDKDLRLQSMDLGDLRQGFVTERKLVVGQQLKYPISTGMVIPPRGLKHEQIVRRGDRIMLVASAGSMQVRMSGTAMDDASLGERVKVKNSSSERIVEGVVDAPGVVKVTM